MPESKPSEAQYCQWCDANYQSLALVWLEFIPNVPIVVVCVRKDCD